ncbi:tetratricopeptide repeat protein [Aestuariibacter sp. AA17]|uniref:Tetratricopeptide repeat protein n=1 Tax=Fluctibacter corallii TaxID=2984329 RepID=A0ABT3A9L9_9ALTE|nr:tetratricopeptide repeat protein [Aestuariibacter sp. AA17]MCV2885328.1 tetratricopeptide repeat protein [Aestuariibacter sp. AA17]
MNNNALTNLDERISRLEHFLEVDKDNPNILGDLAQLYIESGDVDKARQYCIQGLSLDESNQKLLFASALVDYRLEDFVTAVTKMETLSDSLLHTPHVAYPYAYSLLKLHRSEDALRILKHAYQIDEHEDIAFLLARTFYQVNAYDEAILILEKLHAQQILLAPVSGLLSQIYSDMEEWDKAAYFATTALDLDKHNVAANLTQGYVLLKANRYSDASEYFNSAVMQQAESGRGHLGLAITFLFQKDFTLAEQHLHKTLQIQPDLLPAINLLGWLYILQDKFFDARKIFQKGIEIDRNFGEMYGGLAVIEAIQGNEEEARHQVRRSLRLNGTSYSGSFAKIMLLDKRGDKNQAKMVWENLMASKIDESGKTMEDAIIEQIKDYLSVTIH